MRTFIDIEFPDAQSTHVQHYLQTLHAEFRRVDVGQFLRGSPVQNLHNTLRFLGETNATQRAQITDGLIAIAAQSKPSKASRSVENAA